MDINKAVELYNHYNVADRDLIGFFKGNKVYYIDIEELPVELCRIDVTSDGNKSLRLKFAVHDIFEMCLDRHYLCEKTYFMELLDEMKMRGLNKGHVMERVILEKNGCEWKWDGSRYYEAPDFILNGIGYQCKFQDATATTIKVLEKLEGII